MDQSQRYLNVGKTLIFTRCTYSRFSIIRNETPCSFIKFIPSGAFVLLAQLWQRLLGELISSVALFLQF